MRTIDKTTRGKLASRPAKRTAVRLAAVALTAVLAACVANPVTEYTDTQADPKTELMWVSLVHDVGFEVGEAKLSETEKTRIEAFFRDIDISSSDNLVIDPGSFRGGIVEPRIESVSQYLDHHLPAVPYQIGHLGWEETDEAFRIIVGRYLVIPPKCPNFESSTIANPNNYRSSNLGCATETNLALMVANPADLLHGRPYLAGDGMVLANSVARYRVGAIQEVEEVSATGGGEGGGN